MPSVESPITASRRSTSIWRAYSYAWITLVFFLLSIAGHWICGWLPISTSSRP
jgi:uncharacterized membrane protein YesL